MHRQVKHRMRRTPFSSYILPILCIFTGFFLGNIYPLLGGTLRQPPTDLASCSSSSGTDARPNTDANHIFPTEMCGDAAMDAAKRYAADALAANALRESHGPLRIAGFSRLWIPPLHGTGGMQFHAFHIYSQLAARGHHVHVFVTGPPAPAKLKRLAYCTDPETQKTRLCALQDSHARLIIEQVAAKKNAEYDVSWIEACLEAFRYEHAVRPFHVAHSESWAAVPNADQIGIPLAVTWHGSMLEWFQNEINLVAHRFRLNRKMPGPKIAERMQALSSVIPLEEYALLTVPQHIVISDAAAADLHNVHHVDSNRIALIYNGVNRYVFRPRIDNDVRNSFLDSINVPRQNFIVGCGGRLEEIKGHKLLAKAMRLVMTQHHDVTLLVAGNGSLKGLYRRMANDGFSVLTLGMLAQERLGEFYQTIDVFVDPFYQSHGLNTVMIEAALSAVPLIVTGLGSARSVVPCADYGRAFTLGDADGLAREVLYYKFHPEERAAVARRSYERAKLLFGSDTMAGKYEGVLYRMLDKRPSTANITGKLVCLHVYPAMCYREPS